jgi:hypothetical protein
MGAKMSGPMAYNKLPFFKVQNIGVFVGYNELQMFSIGSLAIFPFNLKPI